MRKTLAFLTLSLAALGGRAAHADATCVPARMMIVLDKSSSMNGTVAGSGQTKWEIARQAVGSVAQSYQNKIDLGLNVFPNPGQCAPGSTVVAPASGNAAKIQAELSAPPPATGNWTPMAQSVDAAAADPAMGDPARRPALLIVTDGWQWCSPYDPATRFEGVDAVSRAKQKGIAAYVVGFGDEVDVLTLNRMAVAAGTALPGCDPTGNDISSPRKCYHQADNAAQLQMALDAISVQVSAEICDGIDNDCDGLIDEGLTRTCANACGGGSELCQNGAWSGCDAPTPVEEICDGKDNDCDGTVDESCQCKPGETRACGNPLGACGATRGTQGCTAKGTWGACVGAAMPTAETCNGVDDDCDGEVDNGPADALCSANAVCGMDGTCHASSGANEGGCGCTIGGAPSSAPGAALALVIGGVFVLVLGRRRRA